MIYTFDTYYFDGKARTACLGIADWKNEKPDFQLVEVIEGIEDYESGEFYKRELPCIESILKQVNLTPSDILVVDGYVVLNDEGKLGLGGYLFQVLKKEIPIIGVAKNNFYGLNLLKREILRGESKNPLHITALGIDLDLASANIKSMHGDYRMPTILKMLDLASRED